MKPILYVLGAILFYKVGKEAAYEEVREAFGIEAEAGDIPFDEAQRANAPNQ